MADTFRWAAWLKPVAMRHGPAGLVYIGVAAFAMWPMFAAGSPPGVDAPTFLHLSWVVDQMLTGNLGSIFTDPYWYGGWSYAAAYPPLAYGVVGLLSAVSPIPIEIGLRIFIFLALVSFGLAVYGLALELGLRRFLAAWAGLLSMLSYPVFVSLGIFGWFSTIVAMPFAIAGFAVLERAIRTGSGRTAVVGGALVGASILAHHMTAFAFGIAMVPWAIYRLAARDYEWRNVARLLALSAAGFFAIAGLWILFFIVEILNVGFEREVPGNWVVDASEASRRAFAREYVGREIYPSYVGLVQVPLALAGVIYAFITRSRALGAAIVLVVLAWFAHGSHAMPLIEVWPFSGLDVARFTLFMVPFMVVLGAAFVDSVAKEFSSQFRVPELPAWASRWVLAAVIALLTWLPVQDAMNARASLEPVQIGAQAAQAMVWLQSETPPDATVLAVGFRNWDDWWIPERAGRPVMDGWSDEGAKPWREIREVRVMGWLGTVEVERLHEIMVSRDVDYLVVYRWQTLDSPQMFEELVSAQPDLFERRVSWPQLSIFERIGGP
jgi:hypothetical protein